MSFDPTKPANDALVVASELRSQFTGLKALIDAVPAGPQGPAGPPFASAVVDGTTTLNPGESATVATSFDGTNVHFTFAIPRGPDGGTGPSGAQGPQGAPFAGVTIDGVNTLGAGENATVTSTFDGFNAHLTFGIPRGSNGGNGSDGATGVQGPPGEVTNAALTAAIATTPTNCNAVSDLASLAISDPPTRDEMEAIRQKMNELIAALRR